MATWLSYKSARAFTPRMYRTNGGIVASPAYAVTAWFEQQVNNTAPTVSIVSPTSGGSTLETQVTISGSDFGSSQGNGFVFCKNTRAAQYVSWSDTQIVCKLGMHPSFDGLSDLIVTRDSGQYGTLANAFNALPTPYISVMPVTVSIYGGTKIRLRGWNFLSTRGTGTVTVDGIAVEQYLTWSDGAIDAITPGHVSTGTVNVVVTNSLGYSGTLQIITSNNVAYIVRYFVDPAATGAGTGYSWGDAYTSLQAGSMGLVAGQTLYCRGTENLPANTICNMYGGAALHGTQSSYIKIIGCNASGVPDGTRYVINGNNASNVNTFFLTGNYWIIKNIEITDTNQACLVAFNLSWKTIINLKTTLHVSTYRYHYTLYRCQIKSCDNIDGSVIFCNFTGSQSTLSTTNQTARFYGSIMRSSLNFAGNIGEIINCVIDNPTGSGLDYGILGREGNAFLFGVRVTNSGDWGYKQPNTAGAKIAVGIFKGCFFNNNTAGNIQNVGGVQDIVDSGTNYTGVQGYTNRAGGNYNITGAATNRNVPFTIGCLPLNSPNKIFISAGLNPSLKVSTGIKSKAAQFVGVWNPRG